MQNFQKTFESPKPFAEVVDAVQRQTAAHGFRVLHVHDVAGILAEKGFPRAPLTIIEVCNAKFASEVLARDPAIALMLPCPISVYADGDRTRVATLLPSSIAQFYPQAGVEAVAAEVEKAVLAIVEASL